VRAAVELHQSTEERGTQVALAMSGSTALARRALAIVARQTAQGFTTEGKALALDELFTEMVVVETGISGARQMQDPQAAGVSQAPGLGRRPVFAHTLFKRLIWRTLRQRGPATTQSKVVRFEWSCLQADSL
jgi:hypothetical protein